MPLKRPQPHLCELSLISASELLPLGRSQSFPVNALAQEQVSGVCSQLTQKRRERVICAVRAKAEARGNPPPSSRLRVPSNRLAGCYFRPQVPAVFVVTRESQAHRVKTPTFCWLSKFCLLFNGFLVSPIIVQVSGCKFSMFWHRFFFSSGINFCSLLGASVFFFSF